MIYLNKHMEKKKVIWRVGDVFAVPLMNGLSSIGQIIDLQTPNIIRCAYYSEIFSLKDFEEKSFCESANLIALLASTREQVDFGIWKIIGKKNIDVKGFTLPNEQFRAKGWVGAKIYDAGIVEEFLNAYFGLCVWDDWADPYYLDNLLINKSKKPASLLLKKS